MTDSEFLQNKIEEILQLLSLQCELMEKQTDMLDKLSQKVIVLEAGPLRDKTGNTEKESVLAN